MHAEKIIRALLVQDSAVAALCADRVYPGLLPIGCALPALVVEHISTTERPTLYAQAGFNLMQARIQVTALAEDYAGLKALVGAVGTACRFQRGLIAGVRVTAITRSLIGPDEHDDERTVWAQPTDFVVTYHEP